MKHVLSLILALATLTPVSAARLPANLEPFGPEQVCVGRAEVELRGQADAKLTQAAQDVFNQLGVSLKLGKSGSSYTACPAWLSFQVKAGNEGSGGLVYAATLSLITPGVQTKALENLQNESFDYDGTFEYVTLWSETGYDTAASVENLKFKLRAEVVSQMDAFSADWKKKH